MAADLEKIRRLAENEAEVGAPYGVRDLALVTIAEDLAAAVIELGAIREELEKTRRELERTTKAGGHIARAVSATAAKIADAVRRRR